MPNMKSRRSEHLFTVRIWQEGSREESGAWRGLIEHVRSGQRLYFTTLADLDDFIMLYIHASSNSEERNSDTVKGDEK